jgi:hypothetical protein
MKISLGRQQFSPLEFTTPFLRCDSRGGSKRISKTGAADRIPGCEEQQSMLQDSAKKNN